ncbi:SDR family oxidoreductase [Xanthomonas sp. NCPPB 2654]|uniref:SDR family oxidoreductase n=1 Tax=unclassified Xanthomonas TaxID=2643310 RepID=UPI0021E02268|nr:MULTISPECIES: SDR family oxidoreductase [unclassified Xanthomonas]MDL5364770.1 SDR family oxidoreductase [Xanthomonas sp. NCPPB 2654]UYC22080.1 SDR family oxidoreductase [Xanthomonas sp. CFBP 8443]
MAQRHHPIEQQVMVITGASSGIGLCTALMAAERGAKLVLVARSRDTLDDTVRTIRDAGGEAIAVAADVAEREQLEAAAAEAIRHYGRIDTWVNNAGVAIYGKLAEVVDQDSKRLFDVNFWGVVHGSLVALPHLIASHGNLINLGSEASEAVVPLQGMYSASKHAVKGFTDALRIELEHVDKLPVSVVLIQPTAVDTPYPQHARNYMREEPTLPKPMIAPMRVAEAILHAAEHGGRDVKVGLLAKANTAVTHMLPRLADRMSAMRGEQQKQPVPARDADGTLYRAGESGRIHGS